MKHKNMVYQAQDILVGFIQSRLAMSLISLIDSNQCRNYCVHCLKRVLLQMFQGCLENTVIQQQLAQEREPQGYR